MTSAFSRRALIVLQAADRAAANQASLQFDPVGGDKTFSVGLSADGQEPASHFWASIQMTEPTYEAVLGMAAGMFPTARVVEYDLDDHPERPAEVLVEMGLQTIGSGSM